VPIVAVYGTFMRGQPGHVHLDGAPFLGHVRTARSYRLWLVDGRWPALIPSPGDGVEIEVELYEVARDHLARLAEMEPPGWRASRVELADGRTAEAFVGDPALRERGVDLSAAGGWRAVSAGPGS
jgi:allophanate hydrolase